MNNAFYSAIEDALYSLDCTLDDLGLSADELFLYAKKYKFNSAQLGSFLAIRKELMDETASAGEAGAKKKLSYEEYLSILKGRSASYSDSMVVYKGKVMGRCPAGTTRSGRTCVPGAAPSSAPGTKYKTPDLGGLSHKQVRALSKAKSTQDVIDAHKQK